MAIYFYLCRRRFGVRVVLRRPRQTVRDNKKRPSTAWDVLYMGGRAAISLVHTSNNVEATLSNAISRTIVSTKSKQIEQVQIVSTLSKGRNFNAKLVRHCYRFWQQSLTLLRHCCWCGRGFTATLYAALPLYIFYEYMNKAQSNFNHRLRDNNTLGFVRPGVAVFNETFWSREPARSVQQYHIAWVLTPPPVTGTVADSNAWLP